MNGVQLPEIQKQTKPILLFNDECTVCRHIGYWVQRSAQKSGETSITVQPIGDDPERLRSLNPDLDIWDAYATIHVLMPDGSMKLGGEAVAETLRNLPNTKWFAWSFATSMFGFRPFQLILNVSYAILADVRPLFGVRGSVVDVRFDGHLPPIYSVLRAGTADRHRSAGAARCASRARNRADAHARSGARHGGGGHGRAVEGAGRQRDSLADVRRVRQRHRPPAGAGGCPMAHRASRPAAAGAAFHQSPRSSRRASRSSMCWCRWSAAASGTVRRGGRGQDGAAHRNDPQHDRHQKGVSIFAASANAAAKARNFTAT
jgi:predicted DCC family thiol-disulfide oxidoreductase YuxK